MPIRFLRRILKKSRGKLKVKKKVNKIFCLQSYTPCLDSQPPVIQKPGLLSIFRLPYVLVWYESGRMQHRTYEMI